MNKSKKTYTSTKKLESAEKYTKQLQEVLDLIYKNQISMNVKRGLLARKQRQEMEKQSEKVRAQESNPKKHA